mmetsp:Transcript_27056/g.74617  ORF Transcript_27056/g.74617 Transcript_27056/m.74617 type:complete len:203 (-) Transcript_27056:81-689(-)
MVRCDLADFLDVSLLLLLEADPSERTVLLVAPLSFSKTALRKSGSPKSSESCLRKCAAPSRKAWLVFSTALRSPMSDQRPVSGFLSKKRPAGSIDLIASTMEREIAIFCFLVLVTYNSLLSATRLRKLTLPACLLVVTPLPDKTSLLPGSGMSNRITSRSVLGFLCPMPGFSLMVGASIGAFMVLVLFLNLQNLYVPNDSSL